MTTRTVKMYGLGYGATAAEVTIAVDGVTVYSGDVPTVNAPVPVEGTPFENEQLICTFEIPVEFVGTKPMVCTINSGACISFQQITANYGVIPDSTPPKSNGPDEFYSIAGLGTKDDVRENVYISGVAQNPTRSPTQTGTWYWNLFSGNTLTYDLRIGPATTVTPTPPV